MAFRPRKSVLKQLLLAALGLMVVGGLVLAALPSHKPLTVRPAVQLARSPTIAPSASPQVAGDATAAPTPTPGTAISNSSSKPALRQSTPTPTPAPQVTLQLLINHVTTSFGLPLASPQDACSILGEAKAEGKITSYTLTYYPSYQSDYVSEINGLKDNWTFKLNGSLPPVGCSKVPLQVGDTVTWQFVN
jgi:hypothetical protein